MEYKDYYQILGVKRDAGADEIKRAYRKAAQKYHPDVSKAPDAEARFKEVNEAHEVLKDPKKRAAYDQLGANWQAGQDFRPPPGWGGGGPSGGFEFEFGRGGGKGSAFSDFFESLFGQAGPRGGGFHQAKADQHAKIAIDIEDAYRGASRGITLHAPSGAGQAGMSSRQLNVRIPKGVKAGQKIRLPGQGGSNAMSGQAGDLYLEIGFHPHKLYRPEGRDIHMDLPITPWEAALGAVVKVPTPVERLDVRIPPGAQSGKKLRLKERGIPGKPPGDLYLHLNVVVPKADSDQAKALFEQMARDIPFDPRSDWPA